MAKEAQRLVKAERELRRLEQRFGQISASRKPSAVLKHLTTGRVLDVRASQVTRESQTHLRVTKQLLEIIDRYVSIHSEATGQIKLPKQMARELEQLAIRGNVQLHPRLPTSVRRALQAHGNRLTRLFALAEVIKAKHGMGVVSLAREN